ncbi:malonyl-CoA synthase [Mesorhizobium sp. VK25A]|uniref:Malonyl-CoA synthase n=2 Tax=Mesorhizobium TaxID=68287 RepID=A0ABU5ACQ1_9HYPH|nr:MULTISPECIES: malonyl-CoA synthase [unclassified Mesorhizobium]MDX8469858.1 malonyl-CoA synthase [Mesorhizobium sp. VK23B]MDX8476197.1 malonyl-CoA synthase [Mesorhizobium sp. VK23A]MDX8505552.1 malonyl-CoA synthase [Mesorhizobium sp. VK22E]MDX8534223.1 malonyl-CoA synthase [Mesorhizobium sp. VK25D]MDX8546792.1 malonyl-CoA synthase [Mesorhizobium sp. VK25A]
MHNPLFDALFAPHSGSSRPLLITGSDVVTYDAFLKLAARLANALVHNGAEPGDRVAVQVSKSPEALALYAACVQAGLVFVPLNTAYTPGEVAYFVEDASPRILICDDSGREALEVVADRAGARLMTLSKDRSGTLMTETLGATDAFETVRRNPDDLAALLYTSGTTGRSKGAMLTHDNLLSNARELVTAWRFTAEDTLLHALPIFHTHGLFVGCGVILLAGGTMIFLGGFRVDEIIDWLPRASTMMGVPTFYTRLLEDAHFNRRLVTHMRLFVSGSAPLLATTHGAFERRTGHRILERYGMTETGMNTSNPYEGERRAGTVGFPLPGVELRIVSQSSSKPLPTAEVGEIEVRGRNVCKGYWQRPEKTREDFCADGFFKTGDLGLVDRDGYVHIIGRAKDLIISGGYNIYPKEVELVLDELEGVIESAVVGVPHPDLGEGVIAAVIFSAGSQFDQAGLLQAMQNKIARFKQPKRIFVVAELPRNSMGKVQKNILRQRFIDTFET